MLSINPYINFNGNAETAFQFYRSVLGGEFKTILRYKDVAGPGFPIDEAEADKIIRIVLPIGTTVLIANDVPANLGTVNESENRSKIALMATDMAEAKRIFTGLTEGGTIEMSLDLSPWGTYFGMFRDRYGIEWTVECDA